MLKSTLNAGLLAMLLAGPAFGDDDDDRRRRGHDRDDRYDRHDDDRRDGYRHDNRRYDHRRDDDWRYRPWRNDWDWRNDWRHDPWRNDRRWRHIPPVRYRADFGYRSGYELAWRDWVQFGRHDRHWRRRSFRGDYSYWAGYDAGWCDAAEYYGYGYRPGYWAHDPRDGWYFGFHIDG